MYACMYLFAIDIKMELYIYKFVKSRIDRNDVCDVKYITTYTYLVYHSQMAGIA